MKEKKRLEAKRMPIDPKAKKDPPPLPKADPAPLNIKTKGPPKFVTEKMTAPKPPPKHLAHLVNTDTTVKTEQSSTTTTDTAVKPNNNHRDYGKKTIEKSVKTCSWSKPEQDHTASSICNFKCNTSSTCNSTS